MLDFHSTTNILFMKYNQFTRDYLCVDPENNRYSRHMYILFDFHLFTYVARQLVSLQHLAETKLKIKRI